jgi:dTMP kinase
MTDPTILAGGYICPSTESVGVLRGRFITVEGIDGSGKSTLAAALAQRLGADLTREPTRGPSGRLIREATKHAFDETAVLHLFLADRKWHIENVIEPALEDGRTVVCDRFAHSTMAYQGHLDVGGQLRTMHQPWCPWPDRVLLLDLPVETAMARLRARGNLDAFETPQRLHKVREAYLSLARMEPDVVRILDATQEPEAILRQALRNVGGMGPAITANEDAVAVVESA